MRTPVVAVVILVPLGACGDDGTHEVEGLAVVEGAPELRVDATDFAFSPAEISVRAGEPVNIVLVSTAGGHNLSATDIGFRLPIVDEGETTRGALAIAEPGTYEFVCTVPGHLEQGMRGTIVVEAAL
jgi:nitrite reductase (NO-forming)